MLTDNLSIKLEIEEIKKKLNNQDKNIELVFSYLDELIEKKKRTNPGGKSVIKKVMKNNLYASPLPRESLRVVENNRIQLPV